MGRVLDTCSGSLRTTSHDLRKEQRRMHREDSVSSVELGSVYWGFSHWVTRGRFLG